MAPKKLKIGKIALEYHNPSLDKNSYDLIIREGSTDNQCIIGGSIDILLKIKKKLDNPGIIKGKGIKNLSYSLFYPSNREALMQELENKFYIGKVDIS